MRAPFSFIQSAASGGGGVGSVAVVVGVSHSIVDTYGGGQRIVVEVDDSTGCTTITAHNADGDSTFGDFAIDDATHVSGVPDVHAAGVVDVVVTNATGDSTTGTGLLEYWSPSQITGIDVYLDANKGVSSFGPHMTAWLDQSANARNFTQGVSLNGPTHPASVFDTLPAVRFSPQQWLTNDAGVIELTSGTSCFVVAKWTATETVAFGNTGNCPLTIVGDSVNALSSFGASAGQVGPDRYDGTSKTQILRGSGLNDGNPHLIGSTYDTSMATKVYVGSVKQGLTENSDPLVGGNTYDTIGTGYSNIDGWDGDLGAVVIVSGVISTGDRNKLVAWSHQRFNTEAPVTSDPIMDTSGMLLYFDAALGVTQVSGKVSAWADTGPAGDANRNLEQTTAANRPLYNATDAAYNNQPTVEGVAADDTSLTPLGGWTTLIDQPCSVYLVGQVGGSGSLVDSAEPSGSGGHRFLLFNNGLGQIGLDVSPTTNYLLPGGTPGSPGAYAYLVDGAGTSSAFANSLSSAGVSGSFTDTASFGDLMFFNSAGGSAADGKIAAFIVYSGLHDAATMEAIMDQLGDRFGITITP